jgi:arylsulfatase A-like enzyme
VRGLYALLLSTALGVVGCGEPGATRLAPVHRLVEASVGSGPPLARIDDEGRPVLRAFPEVWLGRHFAQREGETDRAAVWFPLPVALAEAEHVVFVPDVSLAAAKGWQRRPVRLLEVGRWQEAPAVRGVFGLPPGAMAAGAWARATGRRAVTGGHERIESAPLAIPVGARLELGFGMLPEMRQQRVVTFSVLACVESDCTELMRESLDPEQQSDRWHDRVLHLGDFASRTVTLRFEAHQEAEEGRGFMLPVWSDPTILGPDSAVGPSLILVSLDTLRADRLPAYGYPLDTAPFLTGRIAAGGAVFEHAVAPTNMTGPSHLTLFTSLQPSVHGLRGNIREARLPDAIPTLAAALRADGFATGAVTEDGALAYGQGVERGFASYREAHPAQAAGGLIEQTLAGGRAWLDRRRDRRFFLFLHTYQAHTPYRAPERYPRQGHANAESAERWRDPVVPEEWHPESYDREIRYADDAIRAFIEGLERDAMLDDVLVVFFADHGEAFLEHGVLQHAGGLHQEVLHVPMLFYGAGVAPGLRVSAPVGLVDLMPTLLELMGAPASAGGMGRSFAPLVGGAAPGPDWASRPIYSESWSEQAVELRDGHIQKLDQRPPAFAVRLGSRKLIRDRQASGPRYRYYDLAADPGEQSDLYPGDPGAAADLRALVDAYESAMAERRRGLPSGEAADDAPLDPRREEALRALGYLE